jgi:hypothetical protein
MAKKRISSVDLGWLILEELEGRGSSRLTLAIVPDDKRGWRAVVAASSQRFMTVEKERELTAVQNRLRLKRAGPGCLNRISASISGASAGARPPSGMAVG